MGAGSILRKPQKGVAAYVYLGKLFHDYKPLTFPGSRTQCMRTSDNGINVRERLVQSSAIIVQCRDHSRRVDMRDGGVWFSAQLRPTLLAWPLTRNAANAAGLASVRRAMSTNDDLKTGSLCLYTADPCFVTSMKSKRDAKCLSRLRKKLIHSWL